MQNTVDIGMEQSSYSINIPFKSGYPDASEKQFGSNKYQSMCGEDVDDKVSGKIMFSSTEKLPAKENTLKNHSPKIKDYASFEDYLDALVSYDKKNQLTTAEAPLFINCTIYPAEEVRNVLRIVATKRKSYQYSLDSFFEHLEDI